MKPRLIVDAKETSLNTFCFPKMGLSSSGTEMRKHKFVFIISRDRIIQAFSGDYKNWVKESKEDDEQCGGPQDELAEAGYPDLSELLKDPALTELVFGNYLNRELFESFSWDGNAEIKFWFDQITGCTINKELIHFNGICYSTK